MAESLFLIVEPNESERSGLQSCKFGPSAIDFEQVQSAAVELRDPSRTLIVRRHPVEGVSSLLGVKIAIGDDILGYLIAINRQPQASDAGTEPSFADAIGLIEEAATLFATQSQNIHLVLESHQLVLGALHAMSSAIDARDPYTQGHSERVAKLAYEIAKILGISESACQEIYLAGLLHDLGKIGVPDHILHKAVRLPMKNSQSSSSIQRSVIELLNAWANCISCCPVCSIITSAGTAKDILTDSSKSRFH